MMSIFVRTVACPVGSRWSNRRPRECCKKKAEKKWGKKCVIRGMCEVEFDPHRLIPCKKFPAQNGWGVQAG